MKASDIRYMLDRLETEGRGLNKWEEDFLESVREQFERRRELSPRQVEMLGRIYVYKTP